MGFLASTFTWWNGATLGTKFGLRSMAKMGEDALGNVYYQGGKDTAGNPRRWVIYQGATDASRVPPAWFSWLHHQVDDVPDRALPPIRAWQKPAVPNMTGTALAAGEQLKKFYGLGVSLISPNQPNIRIDEADRV